MKLQVGIYSYSNLIDNIKTLKTKTKFKDLNKSIKKDLLSELNKYNIFCKVILNLDKKNWEYIYIF